MWRRAFERRRRGIWAGLGRLLCLRPMSHRGLLRRQQADERIHRFGQCRHQFPAVHGVLRRRPSRRLRQRHRARRLRGFGGSGPCRPRRLQSGLVPSHSLPAADGGAREARDPHRRDRSAPHRDRRLRRPSSRRSRRMATWRSSRAFCAISRKSKTIDEKFSGAAHKGFHAIAGGGERHDARVHGRSDRPRAGGRCAFLRTLRFDAKGRHRLFAGGQSIGLGHPQGERDRQLPSRRRGPHRPSRAWAVRFR